MKRTDETSRLEVKPGFVVLNATEAVGGIHYARTGHEAEEEGEGERTRWSTEKLVDHREVVKAVDALRHRVEYAIRVHGTRTGFGWYCDAQGKSRIEAALVPIREEAQKINAWARRERSARSIHVSVVFAALDVTSPEIAQECYRKARDIIADVRAALAAGMAGSELDRAMQQARNVGAFAPGLLRIAVEDAMARVPVAKAEVKAAIKAGKTPAEAGAACNLDALDAAIEVFGVGDEGAAS